MSDSSQGPGWWQAADGKWYSPDQPPAPGWWRASDGNWYPPQDETPAAPEPAAPTEPTPPVEPAAPSAPEAPAPEPAPIPVAAVPPTTMATPDPAVPPGPPPSGPQPVATGSGPPPNSGSGGKKGLVIVVAVLAVLALIAAGVFVVGRNRSETTATTGAAGQSGAGNTGTTPSGGDSGIPVGSGSGDDVLPSKDITLTDEVVIVKSNGGKAVKKVGADGTSLVLDPAAEGADKLEAGKILLLTGVTVVKVASIEKTSEGLVVEAEPATLPDVIKDGTLDWTDMAADPSKGQLVLLPDGGASEGSGSGSDQTTDDTTETTDPTTDPTTDDTTEEVGNDINEVLGGFRGSETGAPAPGAFEGESAAGVRSAPRVVDKTISGNAGGWGFSISYDGDPGGGHHVVLSLKPKSEMQGEIKTDIKLKPMTHSGHIVMVDRVTKDFRYSTAAFGGTADVTVQLTALQNIASINLPPFFKLPFSFEMPAVIGGIPFMLKFAGTVSINMSLTATGTSLSAEAQVTFDGDAGMHFDGRSLSLAGARVQDTKDLLSKVVGTGQVGINLVTELPKVTFGFGFQLANAGVFIANGMVAEAHVLPAPAQCTALNVAYVLAAGVEASFLTKDIEIGRKAFVDKRWNFQAPNDGRCNRDK